MLIYIFSSYKKPATCPIDLKKNSKAKTTMGNKVTTKTVASKELTAKGMWNRTRIAVALEILISTRNRIAPVNL